MNDPAATDPAPQTNDVSPEPAAPEPPAGPVRATISGGYRFRLLLIGLGLLGFGGWALYDGMVSYPKKQAMWHAFEDFKAEHDDWQTGWPAYASENGYTQNYNKIKELEDFDITTQYIMAGICLPIGAWFFFGWLTAGGRWVEADDRGVRSHKGVDLKWAEIHALEDTRWKTKGIAYLRYGEGQHPLRILLDDWKFDREATGWIYKLAQANVQSDGESEGPPSQTG